MQYIRNWSNDNQVDAGIFSATNFGMGDKYIIPMLNKKLKSDPKTPLPNGYKRIADKTVSLSYIVPPFVGV